MPTPPLCLALSFALTAAGGCAAADTMLYVEDPAARAVMPRAERAAPAAPRPVVAQAAAAAPHEDDPAPLQNHDKPAEARAVIYKAALKVQTDDVDAARTALVDQVERWGGHLQTASGTALTVRVPRARFHQAVRLIKRQGELLDERIEAQDVTKNITELQLRIDNAKAARTRLLALLERDAPLPEILHLENELRRITGEIEAFELAQVRLEKSAALSTISVRYQGPTPPPPPEPEKPFVIKKRSPFRFVRELRPDRLLHDAVDVMLLDSPIGPVLDLPEGFFLVGRDLFLLQALSADDARVQVKDVRVKGGDLSFWADAVEEELVHNLGHTVVGRREVVREDGVPGRELHVTTRGDAPLHYAVTVYRDDTLLGPMLRVVEVVARPRAEKRIVDIRQALAGPQPPRAANEEPPSSSSSARLVSSPQR